MSKPPPAFAIRAALALYRRMLGALDRLIPAELAVLDRSFGYVRTATISSAARYRIADLLEARGPLSADDIAREKSLDADATHRFMRTLVSFGLFELGRDGRFSNNRLSKVLRDRPGGLRNMTDYCGSASNLSAYGALDDVLRDGKNAFERVHGTSVWDWFEKHHDEGRTFAGAMQDSTTLDAPAIAIGFPFGELGSLCDVAGGRGTLLSEILLCYPALAGILFDSQYVLDQAGELLARRGVSARVTKVAGNFFTDVMPKAGGYILKDILHDWGEEPSRKILSNVRRGAEAGARLFVAEVVVESGDVDHPLPMMDLHMMVVCDRGRQRGRAEFERLFDTTGFRLQEIRPLGSLHSLVVGVAI